MKKEEIQRLLSKVNPQSEKALEFSSMLQFYNLGWECEYAEREVEQDSFLGRKNFTEVVLDKYLLPKLKEFNVGKSKQAIKKALEVLKEDRSIMQIVNANKEIYQCLKEGVKVTFLDDKGKQQVERIKVIDWERASNNHFLIVSQFQIRGYLGLRRPDLIGFVNGLPLLFIEYKASDKSERDAYDDNLRDYKDVIPNLFWYNAFCLLSNGLEAKIGSITAGWEYFSGWKKVSTETEEGSIELNTMIEGTCEHQRFIDIVENFIVFMEGSGGLSKIIAKNHQYLGVNNSIKAVHTVQENDGRLGVFWHTQGSGKSISMVFFCQKVLRKISGNWTFVIVTDRAELDTQIYKNFEAANAINETKVQANSVNHLRELLSEDHRYIFTLIHKFQTKDGIKHPLLSDRSDIVVITDEAHRSQYDLLAQNMRNALPKAAFLGFTGTPLISNDQQKTKEVFGDYVSIYNFTQSIKDGATVPLYYENRIPELQMSNDNFTVELNEIIEDSMLDENQEKKLARKFSSLYQLITTDDRLERIAEDIVKHYANRGYRGKAMVICIDKATTVKMYDKVKKYLNAYIENLKIEIDETPKNQRDGLENIYNYLKETDMAVVVSSNQNEVATVEAHGADIRPHRKRMMNEDLEKKFKDADDSFRIVFVCSMWITGFDIPCCSTMYLDKPMKNHTLMQTIARANRVFPDKDNGIIVDYVGIFNSLEKALSIYADSSASISGVAEREAAYGSTDSPIKSKNELRVELEEAIKKLMEFLSSHKVDLDIIRDCKNVSQRLNKFGEARDILVKNEETKKNYIKQANKVKKIYKSYLPDTVSKKTAGRVYLARKLVKAIQSLDPVVNIDEILEKVDDLLDRSIKGYEIEDDIGKNLYDLSDIDFAILKKRFEKSKRKRTEVELLKNQLKVQIEKMIKINETRKDYLEKLEKLIAEYNQGARSVEEIFQMLIELAKRLKEEEKRYIKEGLKNEKELAIFDLLTKPEPKLNEKEIKEVKAVARKLYQKFTQGMLVIDWKKKQETKAKVKVIIEEELDGLPKVYNKKIFKDKCTKIYDYVWEKEVI